MSKLDITNLTRAADDALATTDNPRHRRILENYRRHALLEVLGRWEEIFEADMTVERPVYFLDVDGSSVTLDGAAEVQGFYKALVDSRTNIIVLENEQLAVADWGLATEATFNTFVAGPDLPGGDPEKFYIVKQLIAMHWPYDEQARLIGEHVYEHVANARTIEIPESEFITPHEAQIKLTPLL
jgi:hypothetical protein